MKWIQRIMALLLTAALILTSGFLPVKAEAISKDDIYALGRGGGSNSNDQNILYESPYSSDYVFMGNKYGRSFPSLYFMKNTTNGDEIPSYCIDITIQAESGHAYHRLNLEDSAYAGSVAGQIRAIITNGFYIHPNHYEPKLPAKTHQEAINDELEELAASAHVENLTIGEAISATQLAIWKATHGSQLQFSSYARAYPNTSMDSSSVKYADICKQEIINPANSKPYYPLPDDLLTKINNNIIEVYKYLLSLPPIPADTNSKVVSPASFTDLNNPVFTDNGDGTYTATVTTTVDVALRSSNDWLKLTATLGNTNYSDSVELSNGKQRHTLTLQGIPQELIDENIYLTISGEQTAYGYFMFDALGDSREASQTMVGYDSSRLPVYAEVLATDARSLNIHKTSTNGRPISDIIFDLYYVSTIENSESLPDPENHTISGSLAEYTVITDKNGYASLNFTQHGLPDGVYLVVERYSSKVVAPIDPFYLYVPYGTDFEIHTYPKNELIGGEPEPEPDPTGGANLLKVDADDRSPLAGATFELYRTATAEEVAENGDQLTTIPTVTGKVIKVPFYQNEELDGDPVTSVTSDNDGRLSVFGLDYGTYYLVETAAPAGYNLLDKPLTITINEESHKEDHTITVENHKGSLLPETGGIGTTIYTAGGAILMFIACFFLILNKRKESKF